MDIAQDLLPTGCTTFLSPVDVHLPMDRLAQAVLYLSGCEK